MSKFQKKGVYWIAFFALIYYFAINIVSIPQKQWLLTHICKRTISNQSANSNWEVCSHNPSIQSEAARWDMMFSLTAHIPALITGPIVGGLSDRIGRKPVMIMSILLGMMDIAPLLLISYLNLSLWVLVGAKFICGLFGYWGVLVSVTNAYIADCSTSEKRTQAFFIIQAAWVVSAALGPVTGGYLSRLPNIKVLGVIELSIYVRIAALLFLWIFIKETLPHPKRLTVRDIHEVSTKWFKNFSDMFRRKQSFGLQMLLIVVFLAGFTTATESNLFFWTSYVFNWDAFHHGLLSLTVCGAKLFVMLMFYPLIKRCIPPSISLDINMTKIGLFFQFISRIFLYLVSVDWLLFPIAFLDGMGSIAAPLVRGLLSKLESPLSQGSLFAGIQVIGELGYIIATLTIPNIWAATVGTKNTNLMFQIEAAIIFLGLCIILPLSSKSLEVVKDEEVKENMKSAADLSRNLSQDTIVVEKSVKTDLEINA